MQEYTRLANRITDLRYKLKDLDDAAVKKTGQQSMDGPLGIGTSNPSEKLDVDSDVIRVRSPQTPASAGAEGTPGMICWDSNYIYVCIAANTWKRASLTTW